MKGKIAAVGDLEEFGGLRFGLTGCFALNFRYRAILLEFVEVQRRRIGPQVVSFESAMMPWQHRTIYSVGVRTVSTLDRGDPQRPFTQRCGNRARSIIPLMITHLRRENTKGIPLH